MSDVDPELPEWLVDAIVGQDPPVADVDLVKQAFSWRTVEAELMELTYDSALDDAGVRDAGARRTMEFTLDELTVVIEIDGRTIRGTMAQPLDGRAGLHVGVAEVATTDLDSGAFELTTAVSGPAWLTLELASGTAETPTFVLS
ncbi:MAG: hypothetical protein AAF567_09510 [Actinomycetota bacterium]